MSFQIPFLSRSTNNQPDSKPDNLSSVIEKMGETCNDHVPSTPNNTATLPVILSSIDKLKNQLNVLEDKLMEKFNIIEEKLDKLMNESKFSIDYSGSCTYIN